MYSLSSRPKSNAVAFNYHIFFQLGVQSCCDCIHERCPRIYSFVTHFKSRYFPKRFLVVSEYIDAYWLCVTLSGPMYIFYKYRQCFVFSSKGDRREYSVIKTTKFTCADMLASVQQRLHYFPSANSGHPACITKFKSGKACGREFLQLVVIYMQV